MVSRAARATPHRHVPSMRRGTCGITANRVLRAGNSRRYAASQPTDELPAFDRERWHGVGCRAAVRDSSAAPTMGPERREVFDTYRVAMPRHIEGPARQP